VRETTFKNALVAGLSAALHPSGGEVHIQNAGNAPALRGGMIRGAPVGACDISGVVAPEGWRLEVEVKGPTTDDRPEQARWAERMLRAGAVHAYVRYDRALDLEANVRRGVAIVLDIIAERRGER
jgi:hypothetical protein